MSYIRTKIRILLARLYHKYFQSRRCNYANISKECADDSTVLKKITGCMLHAIRIRELLDSENTNRH